MPQTEAPSFSQAAIESLRQTPAFKKWNRDFDTLKRAIDRQINRQVSSSRDIRSLLKAGAVRDELLERLALVVHDSREPVSHVIMEKRTALRDLAAQLVPVIGDATRLVSDPQCDGRFWLALEGNLSWDLVPKAGVLEARALVQMRALAQLFKDRGDALGQLSRQLKYKHRIRAIRDLLAYISLSTKDKNSNFDAEIACLLIAAYNAVDEEKHFTADQIKKIRIRHLLPDIAAANERKTLATNRTLLLRLGRIDVLVIDDWAMASLGENERQDFWPRATPK